MDKSNIKESIFTYSEFLDSLKSISFLTGVLITLSYWIVDTFIDAAILQDESFIQLLTKPDAHVISMRLVFSATVIIIFLIVGVLLNRSRQAIAALRNSEERFRSLYNDNPLMLFSIDENGMVLSVNQFGIDQLGYPKEQLIGQPVINIFNEEDRSQAKEYLKQCFAEPDKVHNWELRKIHQSGTVIYVRDTVWVVDNVNGKPTALNVCEDITERKQVEKALIESENKYRTLFEQSADAILIIEGDKFVDFNQATLNMLGYKSKKELLNIHPSELSPQLQPDGSNSFEKAGEMISIAFDQRSHRFEWDHKRKNGDVFPVEVLLTAVPFGERKFLHVVWRDITERKQAEEKLQKLSRAVESSSSAVYITDLKGKIEYINPKFTEVTGFSTEEAIGKSTSILQSGETSDVVYADMWKIISSGGEWKGEFHNRKKNGCSYRARNSISGIRNNEGHITHYVAIQEDVTLEHELSEQLSYQANHDTLTGLVNRREFERRADRLLATVHQNKDNHALCFMDLDQFKVVNDTCGHAAGDELLRQLSSVLEEIVRHRDTLARLGGDEFGILMEHCSIDAAHRVATSLQKAIQGYQFSWEGRSFKIGVSIGLVPITETTPNLTELLKNADGACYMAKDQGRNRIHVYHPEDSEMAQRHGEMQWVTRLNQALEDDRFCLYAQAIVPLDSSTDKHYELLLRMVDEKGKIIPPGAFLPAAEGYNLISKIDRWVIENAFGLLKDNPAFLKQINFCSINLSGQSITEKDFLGFVITQLEDSGIGGEKICFEITETAAISNLSKAMKFISTLKDLGCRFALDDFGSGLSSFAYLKNLPVDYLKIDGMFVKDIVDDLIDRAMVKSINEIGQVMGMQTIAEFVENDIIKGILNEIGVNYAQGYGIDKPRPFDELLGRSNNVTDINKPKGDKYES
jgi:diguanylate cyclase (GGDEF)-like protein/PAS domain S-box-containing protein